MPGETASARRAPEAIEQDRSDLPSGSVPSAPAVGARSWDWDDLYARLGRNLVSLGHRRYGLTREDAEEALQSAATAIILSAPCVRSPEAYLTAVFLRECGAVRKKRQKTQWREPALVEGFDPADDSCERIEVVCRFRKAFSLLSPFCRSVMRSCLLDGNPRTVAAAALQGSEKTGYKRYRKCLRVLANALG